MTIDIFLQAVKAIINLNKCGVDIDNAIHLIYDELVRIGAIKL